VAQTEYNLEEVRWS